MAVNAISCCRRLLISLGTDGCPLPTSKRAAAGLILRLWVVAGLCREQGPRPCKELWGSTRCGQGLGTETGLSGTGEPQTGPTAQAWSHQCPREGRGIHIGCFKAEMSRHRGSSTRTPDFGWMRSNKQKAFSGKWKLAGADLAPGGSWGSWAQGLI